MVIHHLAPSVLQIFQNEAFILLELYTTSTIVHIDWQNTRNMSLDILLK